MNLTCPSPLYAQICEDCSPLCRSVGAVAVGLTQEMAKGSAFVAGKKGLQCAGPSVCPTELFAGSSPVTSWLGAEEDEP